MEEPARLRALDALGIMDTEPEGTFDAMVEVAATVFGVPTALITFVDDHRQWFKARRGLAASQTPRDIAFCAVVVDTGELLVVPDAHRDPRFAKNPLVVSDPFVRFYAGAPLVLTNGARVGSFALIDRAARSFGPEDAETLVRLARVAADAIEQRVAKLAERERAAAKQRTLESQLRHAQKMEAVGRLAGGIAHDFNNTLSVILGYAQLIDRSLEADDPRRADVRELTKAGQHAANLTAQLLTFSRKQPLQQKVLFVDDLLRGLASMTARLLGANIAVTWELDANAAVLVDPGSLEQVVMNLAINARDAMPSGGSLAVKTSVVRRAPQARDAVERDFVLVSVTDTGSGMDEATATRIFEPFFTTKGAQGTGLGLAMVLGVVEQHGGFVDVESEVGKGTTFSIHIPVSRAIAPSPPPLTPARPRASGETILLVDDEVAVRRVARRMLETEGYRVLEASSAALALELSAQTASAIDLLLTDITMPGANGDELAEALVAARPGLRVLCMSGFVDQALLERFAERGFGFMQKPFDLTIVRERVREMLDGSSAARVADDAPDA